MEWTTERRYRRYEDWTTEEKQAIQENMAKSSLAYTLSCWAKSWSLKWS